MVKPGLFSHLLFRDDNVAQRISGRVESCGARFRGEDIVGLLFSTWGHALEELKLLALDSSRFIRSNKLSGVRNLPYPIYLVWIENMGDHLSAVNIVDLQTAQLTATQGGSVKGRQNHPMFPVDGAVQDAGNLVRTQYGRQPQPLFGGRNLLVKPGLLQDLQIEELERATVNLDGIRSVLFLVQQVEQISPDVLRS